MRISSVVMTAAVMLLLSVTSACSVLGIGQANPPASPTPMGDTLAFTIPAYTISLNPGETVPGTRLEYLGRSRDTYQVRIDGLEATKRSGDSFIWNGVMAPGVYGNYNLRLIMAVLGPLRVAGPVTVTVFNPIPVERELPADLKVGLSYSNIIVNYAVPIGRQIPGTTLIFEGAVTQGEGGQAAQLAQLSGLSGYPYLALGDSLVWTGQLRDNLYVRHALRVASINQETLRVAGTADMWIAAQE